MDDNQNKLIRDAIVNFQQALQEIDTLKKTKMTQKEYDKIDKIVMITDETVDTLFELLTK